MEDKLEKQKARQREYYLKNKERLDALHSAYQKAHREEISRKQKARREKKKLEQK